MCDRVNKISHKQASACVNVCVSACVYLCVRVYMGVHVCMCVYVSVRVCEISPKLIRNGIKTSPLLLPAIFVDQVAGYS